MAAERSTTKHWIDALRIKTPTPQTPVGSLSGGNQQKVVLAKWLAAGVELLILDHPTRGVDVGAKEEVYQLVRQLTSQGKAMLLVADTLDEAIGLSHRVICMRDGRVTATFSAPAGGKPTQLELISAIT